MGCGVRRYAVLLMAAAACARATTFYVTVTGLGGEPAYEQQFALWGKDIDKVLRDAGGDVKVETLIAPTREKLRAAAEGVARTAKAEDAVAVMLIGHGTWDGYEYKFNLPGPDIGANELAHMLDGVRAARQLVVNMTSASGGALEALRRPGRIVVSATKTGTEKNATIFARYWAEALRDPVADTDKNETVSALEAFLYAQKKTAAFYETEKRLATEHAVIEDGGGKGGPPLAGVFPVLRMGRTAAASRDPAKLKLLAQKEDVEQRIDRLKFQKAVTPPVEYKKQLTSLLLELARTQEELDK
jgi:hypothetical protein